MIVTQKSLSRRTVLRGLGATVALPLLDAMVPALSAAARSVTAPVPRLAFFYVPNGMLPRNFHPQGNGGVGLRVDPGAGSAHALPRSHDGGDRPEQRRRREPQRGRRRPHPRARRLAQRHPAEAHRRGGHPRRQDHRPVRRRQARSGHRVALAGADHRIELPGRQLRERLQLRLPQLHVLAHADDPRCPTSATRASFSSACSATAAASRRASRR